MLSLTLNHACKRGPDENELSYLLFLRSYARHLLMCLFEANTVQNEFMDVITHPFLHWFSLTVEIITVSTPHIAQRV